MTDRAKYKNRVMFGLGYTVLYKTLYDYRVTMRVAFMAYESTRKCSAYAPTSLN